MDIAKNMVKCNLFYRHKFIQLSVLIYQKTLLLFFSSDYFLLAIVTEWTLNTRPLSYSEPTIK